MTYQKPLGRVIGDRGAILIPTITDEITHSIISWEADDHKYDGVAPAPTEIKPLYYIPYMTNDGILYWGTNKDKGINQTTGRPIPPDNVTLPPDTNLIGPMGPIGSSSIRIEVVHNENPNITDPIQIIKENCNDIQEGNIFLVGEEAWIYDAQSDTSHLDAQNNGQPVYHYDDNAFYRIESPIDLSNYYNKTEMDEYYYNKICVNNKLGDIENTQQIIKNVLNNMEIDVEDPNVYEYADLKQQVTDILDELLVLMDRLNEIQDQLNNMQEQDSTTIP